MWGEGLGAPAGASPSPAGKILFAYREFGSESSEEALATKGSKEDVRASSYYSLQLHLCLKLWIKTYPRDLRRITDKFSLCSALIFPDKCVFLYQAYGAVDFKSH